MTTPEARRPETASGPFARPRWRDRIDESEGAAGSGAAPLWLPRGSVRALMAISVLGVWAALELGAAGGGVGAAPDAVRTMAIGAAAGYGAIRGWERRRGQDDAS